jgi:hypothetical protein
MWLRNTGPGFQGDAPESFVVDIQGVASLLNLPVVCAGARRQLREKRLYLHSSQVPATPTRVAGKEFPYPGNAVRNVFFLGAGLAKRVHVTIRPAGLWNRWRHDHQTCLRHINSPSKFDMPQNTIITPCMSTTLLRHIMLRTVSTV